jgi:DNA-binding transcriptional ArsR family regulator
MDAVFKALADPTRRAVIELLRKRDMTAGEIAENFSLSKPTLSKHFAVLKEANLIYGEKSATTITYRLNLSVLEEASWAAMNAFQIANDGKKLWKNKGKLI